ncbi:ABC transporter permease [uncultured Imperialibacter sp.]|uniref:ABC transporter permease n=1 Tax=uncultured Imperialibacter sp. TaxID=1672639 RepID=UPI0030DBC896|tara:strand:- start:33953 stop:36619 length:2667 start_codon:yes stop_codon:yes gene_type:complete
MSNHHPPKLPLRFFRWFCHPDYREDIEGDLVERFKGKAKERGAKRASWFFAVEVLKLFRPSLMKNFIGQTQLNNYGMFRNYFKIAWRNMIRQKMYSAIKVGGLSIGIAACLVIAVFIQYELSYDQQYPDKDRIYRVIAEYNVSFGSGHFFSSYFQHPFARTIQEEFPEIEKAGRVNQSSLFGAGGNQIRPAGAEQSTYEEHVAYFDQELLQILQPEMVEGSLKSALAEPNSIVLSRTKAKQFFPGGSAVGQTLIFNEQTDNPYIVGGVMEDFPENNSMEFDILISLTDKEFWKGERTSWLNTNYPTYIKVKPGADIKALESKLSLITEKFHAQALADGGYATKEEIINGLTYHLQPITDIHLNKGQLGEDGFFESGIGQVRLFGLIAIFILLLACVNFVNLSTAKSATRAKEIGLRKTLGSSKAHLVQQFLIESTLFSLLAFVVGMLLAWLSLPYLGELSGKNLTFPATAWWLFPALLLSAGFIGVLAGIYPSLYLSRFRPVAVLKGGVSKGAKNALLRNVLVVFQFTTAIAIITGTVVINSQMDYILTKPLGFDKEQVILLRGTNTLGDKTQALKNELLALSAVENVSVSDYLPVYGPDSKRNGDMVKVVGRGDDQGVSIQDWQVDEDYLGTMGMKLTRGRDFAEQKGNNQNKVIVNETLVRKLGLDDPIGQKINNGNEYEIIGVVEDFHFDTFAEEIQGVILHQGQDNYSVISVKANTDDVATLLASIETVWNKFAPGQPMRYDFMDARFDRMYEGVAQYGDILNCFSVLALVVACLGLFGLSAFMAEQRSKEISIRKVLGASVSRIFKMLTGNFLKLVLISFVLAVPIAWYFMQSWLDSFSYRIDMSWWYFGLAGVAVTVVALITVSSQALKVAHSNPVDSLRNE